MGRLTTRVHASHGEAPGRRRTAILSPHHRRCAAAAFAFALAVVPLGAVAKEPPVATAAWTRPLAGPPQPKHYLTAPVFVLQPLADGSLLARNGTAVTDVDPRGRTRWSMPNVADAIVDGSAIVFRRPNLVFAARTRDGAVLWKRRCDGSPFVVTAGRRIVTVCGGLSTVLRASDGAVLARRKPNTLMGQSFAGARPLNDDYVLVTTDFDGAWLGSAFYVVDAHTGAFLWQQTDFAVVDVTATTIAITPFPSMLPWGSPGVIVRRRLVDGVKVGSRTYDFPVDREANGRGSLALSRAAAYVITSEGAAFRYARGDVRHGQRLPVRVAVAKPLGSAGFLFAENEASGTASTGSVYLDRPGADGAFALHRLGSYGGGLTFRDPRHSSPVQSDAVEVAGRLAIADEPLVRLYDEFGTVDMVVRSSCTEPQLAATRAMLFVSCLNWDSPGTLAAYALPGSLR